MARHSIDTGDTLPVKQSLRRMPPAKLLNVADKMDKMLQQGIIKPNISPWSSPIVFSGQKKKVHTDSVLTFANYTKLPEKMLTLFLGWIIS